MNLKFHPAAAGRRPCLRAAFTMIEIALAVAVIGFAMVAIIGVLPAGMTVQRDNRESTIVNFDAGMLMSAITSGTTGLDDLTNHIIAITNVLWLCSPPSYTRTTTNVVAYTTNGTFVNGSQVGPSYLTNGANIIALLTTPKYIPIGLASYQSNYATADFRAFTGSLADQGRSQDARSFAFAYRVYPEIIPNYQGSEFLIPVGPDSGQQVLNTNMQNNLTHVRLRFRWPILPNGQAGASRLTFRTETSGSLNYMSAFPGVPSSLTSNAYFQPGTYFGE